VNPAYYGNPLGQIPADACNTQPAPRNENKFGPTGLDNDGDGLYDQDDPDCAPPPVEICDNGSDDDGDGLADCADPQCEGFVGAATTCGVGACAAAGNLLCVTPNQVDNCTPLPPSAEGPFGSPTCADGIDNDCDGATDAADADCAAPPEICDNGIDDNGNGLIDCADPQCEGFVGAATTCGVGACAAGGNLVCVTPNQVDNCTPLSPSAEGPFGSPTCADGIDNDCDGATDAADPDCQAPAEICDNGLDDNGNGLIDCADPQCEGFVGAPTTCGVGACAATGNLLCQGGQQVDSCQPGQAGLEGPFGDATCADGIDNDCDGATDAADPNCQQAAVEICDNAADDDGDGLVDCADADCNGFRDGPCDTGLQGVCGAGTLVCQNLQPFCEQNQQAGVEGPFGSLSCANGLDDDCDGLTDVADPDCAAPAEVCDNGVDDNGNGLVDCADLQCEGANLGACDTGLPGVCAAGTAFCQGGAPVCLQNQQAEPEICTDGLDNDCDGLTDAADPDCQVPVEQACFDGIDNDADGLIDCADPDCNGVADGACDTGQPGVCAAGTLVCQGGGSVCQQNQQPGIEGPFGSATCGDGLDNDCDGFADAADPDCQAPPFIPAEVDAPGAINGRNAGVTPVEIMLGLPGTVNLATLSCGAAPDRLVQCVPGTPNCRVNRSGPNAFVALINTRALALACADTAIVCEGTLADGTPFQGMDAIRVVRDVNNQVCR
jgi:hypothetical protein